MGMKIYQEVPRFAIVGDGAASQIVIDLADPPLNLDLKGNTPDAVVVLAPATGVSATILKQSVTLAFDPVLGNGVLAEIRLALKYPGA